MAMRLVGDEELLLVETTAIEIALKKGSGQAEGLLCGAVMKDLLGFERAIGVVAGDPVAKPLGKGVVIEMMLQIPH